MQRHFSLAHTQSQWSAEFIYLAFKCTVIHVLMGERYKGRVGKRVRDGEREREPTNNFLRNGKL